MTERQPCPHDELSVGEPSNPWDCKDVPVTCDQCGATVLLTVDAEKAKTDDAEVASQTAG